MSGRRYETLQELDVSSGGRFGLWEVGDITGGRCE